jgi:hypothetical protein
VRVPDPSGGTSQRIPPAAVRSGWGTTIQVPGPAVRIPVPSQRAAVPGGTRKPVCASPEPARTEPGSVQDAEEHVEGRKAEPARQEEHVPGLAGGQQHDRPGVAPPLPPARPGIRCDGCQPPDRRLRTRHVRPPFRSSTRGASRGRGRSPRGITRIAPPRRGEPGHTPGRRGRRRSAVEAQSQPVQGP